RGSSRAGRRKPGRTRASGGRSRTSPRVHAAEVRELEEILAVLDEHLLDWEVPKIGFTGVPGTFRVNRLLAPPRPPAQCARLQPAQTTPRPRAHQQNPAFPALARHPLRSCRDERRRPAPRGSLPGRVPEGACLTPRGSTHGAEKRERKTLCRF